MKDALILLAVALVFMLVNILCRWLVGFTDIRSELAAWAFLAIGLTKLFTEDVPDEHDERF
jgi:hypothetical protein